MYLPEWEDVERVINPEGWVLVAPLDIGNTEAMVCQKIGAATCALVFRGTEASRGNLWDLAQNVGTMAEWGGPGSVHSGYNNYVDKIFPHAARHLEGAAEVYITGHSMGGAAATLYALKASLLGAHNITALVTFGSPKCMNKEAAGSFPEQVPIRRYVNSFDLAVYWPLNPWFVHVAPPVKHPGRGHSITRYKESFK